MAIRVAHGLDDRRLSVSVDAEEMMGSAGGGHRIDGDLQAPFRPILETYGHGDATGNFTMRLTFGGAGTDGGPTDEIGKVLRADGIEQLRRAGHAGLINLQENGPGELHACGNVAGAVKVGVVNQPFPPNRRPGFFKIGSHDDQESIAQRIGDRFEFRGVFVGCFWVMDRAGADDYQQPFLVLPMQDSTDGSPGFNHQGRCLFGDGERRLNSAW